MEHGYGSAFFMDELVYAPCSPPRQHAMKTTKTSPRVIDNSRFRMQQEQAKAMIGVVPLMSFYPNRTNPREDIIKRVRAIIMKGVMSQKRIAEEIGLRLVILYYYRKQVSISQISHLLHLHFAKFTAIVRCNG
jgi:hypothetical protein